MDVNQKRTLVEQWYRQYSKLLFHAACLLDTPDAAEEIVQETFRIVMETDDLEQVEYSKTWLRKIVYNVVQNRQRRQERFASVPIDGDEGTSVEELGSHEDEPDVELEYGGIVSAEDLHLLRLSSVEQHTYSEIAEELGISAEACRKRVDRAKKELRKKLEKDRS